MMQSTANKPIRLWILIVSWLFALMELGAGLSLFLMPEAILENIDFNAEGVKMLVYMWATRQIALGIILSFSALIKSSGGLQTSFVFLVVMFFGDVATGMILNDSGLTFSALFMGITTALILYLLFKQKSTESHTAE